MALFRTNLLTVASRATLAAAAAAVWMSSATVPATAKELQMSYFVGQRHPMVKAVVVPMQEKLAEVSGGKLTIKVHYGGSLVKGGPPQYGAMLQGVSDLAFSLPGYLGPKFPFSNSITIPGVTDNGVDATNKLWNAMDIVASEYDAKIMALWSVDPKILLTRKPARALVDLKGQKYRVTSKDDEQYVNLLGAVAVASGVTVVHQNFTNGVIDGVHIGASAIRSFKLYEPAKYVTTNLPVSSSGIYILMNRKLYEGLSAEERGWIDQVAGRELSLRGGNGYNRAYSGGLKVAFDNGVEEVRLTGAEQAAWQAAMQPAVDKWLSSTIDTSRSISKLKVTGQQLVDAFNKGN